MAESSSTCVEPAKGPILPPMEETGPQTPLEKEKKVMAPLVGNPAPDFEANAYFEGGFKTITLSDYKGKWILLCFYPGDFTFVWPTELAAVAAEQKAFEELGVQVLSVSTDSRFTHKIWQEEELSKMVEGGFPFPMLSDQGGRIGTIYGVYDAMAGVDIRGRFIIDPDFVIQAMEVLTPSVGRKVQESIRQLKAFQHVRATREVTPAGWEPGKKTLTPSPALAGKVWKIWKVGE